MKLGNLTANQMMLVAGGGVLVVWYLKGQAGKAVQAINPVNPDNIFNQGFNGLYDGGFDGQGTLGTDIYEWNEDLNRKYYKYTPLGVLDRVASWWN